MPSEPVESGSIASTCRPASVRLVGEEMHVAAVRLHEDAAVRLLVVADLDHEDLDVDAEQRARDRQRAAPLAGAGLGGDLGDALLLVVVGLRDGGVGLVGAGRGHALVLVEDLDAGGQAQVALELRRTDERRGPIGLEDVADLFGNLDETFLAHLLFDELHREDRRERLGTRGVSIGRQRRSERLGQVRLHVVPRRGQVLLIEQVPSVVAHRSLPFPR